VARWLETLGELEALCDLAGYAFEHPGDPFPEIAEGGPVFDASGLGHPLLDEARCVRNDLALDASHALVVVSGSNMSGKSTFLRSVGTAVVMALAGAPVRAARLRVSPLALGAVLNVQDSLREGASHFYAELLALRRVVERCAGPLPVLFLLDEILSGTNSHDRRIGAEALLRRLLASGAIGLVTTHDLALTAIANELAPRARNAHFEDQVADGTLRFDYRLREGVITRGNALALMRAVGLDFAETQG
jgi:DNA mismatch repair ATPase MutS